MDRGRGEQRAGLAYVNKVFTTAVSHLNQHNKID